MRPIYLEIKYLLWRVCLKYLVNPKKVIMVEGNKMFLDDKDSLLLSLKPYEKENVEIIKKIVQKEDVILDIGANIGYFTLILAKIAGEKGKVFAFEPYPKNFEILKKNIEVNNYKNVILENKAVFNKNEKIKLFLSPINNGAHRIFNTLNGKNSIEVEAIKLDDYLKNKKIDFFKMDIEGAELNALIGMESILKNKDIKFIMEFSPENLRELNKPSKIKELLDFLENKGFILIDINKRSIIKKENLLEKAEKKHYFNTTLLGIKKDFPKLKETLSKILSK